MQTAQLVNNPFALLLDPSAVLAQVERSERLNRLSSRICRPLDKPTPGTTTEDKPAEPDEFAAAMPTDLGDLSDIVR